MSSFFKKRCKPPTDPTTTKRQRTSSDTAPSPQLQPNPHRIACWNCNGLSARLRCAADTDNLKAFLVEHAPDVLFLSEVRLPAAHNAGTRKPSSVTTWYRSRIRDSDATSNMDFIRTNQFLRSEECARYRAYFSLADTKYAGTAMLLNTLTTSPPASVRYNLKNLDVKRTEHDPQGRVIYAKFADFSILHTYVPNNGWDDEHFKRRQAWDESMKSFMRRKKEAGVKIMWIGDLNIAPKDEDLSHAAYFRRQTGGRDRRRNRDKAAVAGEAICAENVGQPGCTDGERKRFAAILEAGGLADAYRETRELRDDGQQHEEGTDEKEAVFTWRGTVTGKLGDKGMRIDHCVVSRALLARVERVSILGGAGDARPGFMGSDHCPLVITVCNDGARGKGADAKDSSSPAAPAKPQSDDEVVEQSEDVRVEANVATGARSKKSTSTRETEAQADHNTHAPEV